MQKSHLITLICILIVALGFRFYGLDWGTNKTGEFHTFHPDEQTLIDSAQHIGNNLQDIVSSYGKAPMYVLSATAHTLGYLTRTTPFTEASTSFTYLTARYISAILSLLTVFLTFLIGRQLGNTTTGLTSALFLALCVGHIQQSHYYTVDIFLTFWVTLCLYFTIRLPSSKIMPYILFGIAIGIAAGTRLVGVWLGIPFLLAHILNNPEPNFSFQTLKKTETWKNILLATALGILVLLICEPLLILDPNLFFSDNDVRRLIPSMKVARGEIIRIWSLYDFSTTPYLFYVTHLLRDALGYPLEIAALLGIGGMLYKRPTIGILLLSWLIPYFLLIGGLHTKPIRYTTPMLPILCITAAYLTHHILGQWLQSTFKSKALALTPSILIALPAGLYACAFTSIYHQEDSRFVAQRWISQNMPTTATILAERGGFSTFGMVAENYDRVKTDQASFFINTEGFIPYWEQIAYAQDQLLGVDWIVSIDENRARQFEGAPNQYPIGHAYYHKLQNGELGFTIAKTFQNTPSLWGWSFYRTDSDPTTTAYDHPHVTIYKRTGHVQQALQDWIKKVQTDPTWPDHLLIKGIQAYKQQDWHAAQNAFQKAHAIRPNYLLCQIMLVNTWLKSGQNQQADALWKKLEQQYGGIPDEIGMGLSKAGLYHEGILYLERSIALYAQQGGLPKWIPKTLAESWYLWGLELLQAKHFEEAQTAFQNVIKSFPDHSQSYQALGHIALQQNQLQEAHTYLEKAMALNLRDAETWYLLGKVFQQQNDLDNARFYYQQATGLAPGESKYKAQLQTFLNQNP